MSQTIDVSTASVDNADGLLPGNHTIEGISPAEFDELVVAQGTLFLLIAKYKPSNEALVHIKATAFQGLSGSIRSEYAPGVDLVTHLIENAKD